MLQDFEAKNVTVQNSKRERIREFLSNQCQPLSRINSGASQWTNSYFFVFWLKMLENCYTIIFQVKIPEFFMRNCAKKKFFIETCILGKIRLEKLKSCKFLTKHVILANFLQADILQESCKTMQIFQDDK